MTPDTAPHHRPPRPGFLSTWTRRSAWALPVLLLLSLWLLLPLRAKTPQAPTAPVPLAYEILATQPHNPHIFTQGLIVRDGLITATSGLYGRSFVVQYRADTGEEHRRKALPPNLFAEGIERVGDRLVMLTWREQTAWILDADTLKATGHFAYEGEGWGLTYDGTHLISSDGSDRLTFRTPDDFLPVHTLTVRDHERTWARLNELEYAYGHVWANVWQTPVILRIDPATGQVLAQADLSELERINSRHPGESVLNGIAYDSDRQAFWITGKLWPNRYLVRFFPATATPSPEK